MTRKKILFVSARLPFPALEGHQIRALGVLMQLAKFADVHLLSIVREGEALTENSELYNYCASVTCVALPSGMQANVVAGLTAIQKNQPLVVTKYVTRALRKAFKEKLEIIKPDIVHLDLLPLAGLLDLVPRYVHTFLNEHNVEADLIEQKQETLTSFTSKIIYARELKILRAFESWACQNVTAVLACSNEDKISIEGMGAKHVHCIPNGVDTAALQPDHSYIDVNKLVFLGGMGWYPNKLGIEWFIEFVMPILVAKNPKIKVDLIGNPNPEVAVPNVLKPYIHKLGFVDDFKPYVREAGIMIVPLHVGSGTRLKVVEGAALGKCMVSTHKGAQGVNLENNKDIVYADTPHEFALAILDLQKNKERMINIGSNARRVAEATYDWNAIGEKLRSIYHQPTMKQHGASDDKKRKYV